MNKKHVYRYCAELLAVVAVVITLLNWQSRNMLATETAVPLSAMTFSSLVGEDISLTTNNKPWLIYFFAPWCSICGLSIDNVETVSKDDYNLLFVALDYQSVANVKAFVKQHSMTGDVVLGNNSHRQIFRVDGYPSYYVFDKNGVIKAKHRGYSTTLGLTLHTQLTD